MLHDVPEEVCELSPRKVCRPVTRLVPSLEPSRQVSQESEQIFSEKYFTNISFSVHQCAPGDLSHGQRPAQAGQLPPQVRYSQAGGSHWSLLIHYCALIGPELHSDATPAPLCHKEPAQGIRAISCLSLVLYGIRISGFMHGKNLL